MCVAHTKKLSMEDCKILISCSTIFELDVIAANGQIFSVRKIISFPAAQYHRVTLEKSLWMLKMENDK